MLMNSAVHKQIGATGIRIKPEKSFLRLDQPFNDAVRAKKLSAITSVLLRADLPGKVAGQMAAKILADADRRR